jgi:hypothetical protein
VTNRRCKARFVPLVRSAGSPAAMLVQSHGRAKDSHEDIWARCHKASARDGTAGERGRHCPDRPSQRSDRQRVTAKRRFDAPRDHAHSLCTPIRSFLPSGNHPVSLPRQEEQQIKVLDAQQPRHCLLAPPRPLSSHSARQHLLWPTGLTGTSARHLPCPIPVDPVASLLTARG